MPGYRLDNFDFVAADPETRPKRTGRGGKSVNMDAALSLLSIVQTGKDATDDKEYPNETDARGVSQAAARLLKQAIVHEHLEDKITAGTRVWQEKKKWHWRVFLRNIQTDDTLKDKAEEKPTENEAA